MAPRCRSRSGVVERISERICPHVFRMVALSAPTEREKSQMCIQRYMPHLPPKSSASRHIICTVLSQLAQSRGTVANCTLLMFRKRMYGDFDNTSKELVLDTGLAQFVQIYMPARNCAARTREEYRSDLEDSAAFLRDRRIAPGRWSACRTYNTSCPIWTAGVLSPHPAIARPTTGWARDSPPISQVKKREGQ